MPRLLIIKKPAIKCITKGIITAKGMHIALSPKGKGTKKAR
ncbi:hypothetical protein [Mucilaginibacter sp.]